MIIFTMIVSVLVAVLMVLCYAILAIASEAERKAEKMREDGYVDDK